MEHPDLRQALAARRTCPLWVRVWLFGSYVRREAVIKFWFGVALVPALVAWGLFDWRLFLAAAFLCVILAGQTLSFRWVDRNNCWP
ncbi:MAG: hypothetical protein U0872_02620 [Planctomycetaceae bacterium]